MASQASIRRSKAFGLLLAILLSVLPSSGFSKSDCARVNVQIDRIPPEVCSPPQSNDFDLFDAYSWQAFLAVVRPAGLRGEPDLLKPIGATGTPLVFETYKAPWEVFVDPTQTGPPPAPVDWSDRPSQTPCGPWSPEPGRDLIISSFGGLEDDLGQAGAAADSLEGPIASQNHQYVRYTIGYNKILFDEIRKKRLDLESNLTGVDVPVGSVAVKAAWMILTDDVPKPERYYSRWALVQDPVSRSCGPQKVALLGLHVIQKTQRRLQFVWSTFEHVDNVPPGPGPFALHDGQPLEATQMPNPLTLSHPVASPTPFNIIREVTLGDPAIQLNTEYDAQLRSLGVVWQNYRLVMTQWPKGDGQRNNGQPANTVPGTGSDATSYANPVLETFFQKDISKNGCMSCHDKARADFLWSLEMHAWRGTRREPDR